jgi:lipid II:glycine glycyltransferase (peptidoglycan interpeptide bridge formation enzyme)
MTTFYLCQNKLEWDNYILEHDGHPLQLWGWGDVKAAHGWQAYRLFGRNNDQYIVGAVQVLVKKLPWPFKSLAYVPRGPIVDNENREDFLTNLAIFIKKNYHSVALSIEPSSEEYNVPADWIKSANRILPSDTIILDLEKPESELLSRMAKKTRQYIRKSSSEGIEIKRVKTHKELIKCLEIYHSTSKRAGFNLHNDQYYFDIFDKLNDHSPVYAAYFEDKPIAFLWLVISAETAFELYGGMDEQGQTLRANYALKWHVIRKCKEWGISRYDFGGLIDGGVSTFKMNWTDQDTQLAGTFDKQLSSAYSIWSKWLPTLKKIARKIR